MDEVEVHDISGRWDPQRMVLEISDDQLADGLEDLAADREADYSLLIREAARRIRGPQGEDDG